MKKTIAMLLVAMLAVSSVFAAFSGEASLGFGVNLDSHKYGFIDNGTSVTFNYELGTESGENVGEGDIYASIKGSLGIKVLSTNNGIDNKYDASLPVTIVTDDEGKPTGTTNNSNLGLGLTASISEAKVYGENWYVSILGVPGAPDFAKSAIDTYKKNNSTYGVTMKQTDSPYTWTVPYVKAPGVEVGVADYKFGAGFVATATKDNLFSGYQVTAYAATPEYDFDGVAVQGAAAFTAEEKKTSAIGGSLKLGFSNDTLSASVATDLGFDIEKEEFGMDVAANVVVSGITIDGYFALNEPNDGGENYLSARVKADLNNFDVPVALTVTGKNLINTQDLDASVEFAIGDVTLTPCVGYVIKDGELSAGIGVGYTHEYFTLSAETNFKTTFNDDLAWDAEVSLENETLISGATLSLAWTGADNLLKEDFGKITASISMSF